MDLQLAQKVFVVTGGTSGLGLATAECLVQEGARVLITGRTRGKYAEARERLQRHAGDLAFIAGDNADTALPARIRDEAITRWGRLDGLLVSVGGPPPGQIMSTNDDVWRDAFEGVFLGAVRLIRELAPSISDGGSILLALAASAKEAAPILPVSNGLRPGLAMVAKNFANELGPRNIRVNSLLTGGFFATDRMKTLFKDKELSVENLFLKRVAEPMEFGRMAAVLLSPVASYMTGAAVALDGGQVKSL